MDPLDTRCSTAQIVVKTGRWQILLFDTNVKMAFYSSNSWLHDNNNHGYVTIHLLAAAQRCYNQQMIRI